VKGSLTYANPKKPERYPPLTRRADYPLFTKLEHPLRLSVETFAKLSRAVDKWSGSIAVYGAGGAGLQAWGVVDQMVHQNTYRYGESSSTYSRPGTFAVEVDGPGEISAFHHGILLGALRQDRLYEFEPDALRAPCCWARALPSFTPIAAQIDRIFRTKKEHTCLSTLLGGWTASLARVCVGLRRLGTGGTLLLTPHTTKPDRPLKLTYRVDYRRMAEATVLRELDSMYDTLLDDAIHYDESDTLSNDLVTESRLAKAQLNDRERELTGAVKFVTSLAAVDGLVLLTPTLHVDGFGAKITLDPHPRGTVCNGAEYEQKGTQASKIDASRYGTRHGSAMRYCEQDKKAMAVVVSQDGQVRVVTTTDGNLLLWDNVSITNDSSHHRIPDHKRMMARFYKERRKSKEKPSRGYTFLPQSLDELMAWKRIPPGGAKFLRQN
jgi:hypothetical protein